MNVSVFLRVGAALVLVAGLLGAGCGGSGGSVEKSAAPIPPPVAAIPSSPVVAARYVVTDLDSTRYYSTLNRSLAVVVNNAGQVAVNLDNSDGLVGSVLRSGGESFNIPPLRSDRKNGRAGVSAINDAGQMVGGSDRGDGGFGPYLWDTTGLRALKMLPDSQSSFPTGMNNRGQIVGVAGVLPQSRTSPVVLDSHVVLWEAGGAAPRDLGLGKAVAINDQGMVIGSDTDYRDRLS